MDGATDMRSLFYAFSIGFAGSVLFVIVNRFEPNRRLATLLMMLLIGVTAAAVLNRLMP